MSTPEIVGQAYEHVRPLIVGALVKAGIEPAVAQDVVQDMVVDLLEHPERYQGRTQKQLQGWFMTRYKKRLIDHMRSERQRKRREILWTIADGDRRNIPISSVIYNEEGNSSPLFQPRKAVPQTAPF